MTRRASLPKLVYGKRDPDPEEVTDDVTIFQGRKPRASKCVTRKLERRCPTCGRPMLHDDPTLHCSDCIARSKRKPRNADSLQEAAVYADANSRRTLYRSKGRLA